MATIAAQTRHTRLAHDDDGALALVYVWLYVAGRRRRPPEERPDTTTLQCFHHGNLGISAYIF